MEQTRKEKREFDEMMREEIEAENPFSPYSSYRSYKASNGKKPTKKKEVVKVEETLKIESDIFILRDKMFVVCFIRYFRLCLLGLISIGTFCTISKPYPISPIRFRGLLVRNLILLTLRSRRI